MALQLNLQGQAPAWPNNRAIHADLGPSKEERHLLPGTIARPCDVTIRRWMNGKDGAIDVTVTSPLSRSNVAGAAAEAGASLAKACKRKTRDTAEATGHCSGKVQGNRGGRGDKPAIWEVVADPPARQRFDAVNPLPRLRLPLS